MNRTRRKLTTGPCEAETTRPSPQRLYLVCLGPASLVPALRSPSQQSISWVPSSSQRATSCFPLQGRQRTGGQMDTHLPRAPGLTQRPSCRAGRAALSLWVFVPCLISVAKETAGWGRQKLGQDSHRPGGQGGTAQPGGGPWCTVADAGARSPGPGVSPAGRQPLLGRRPQGQVSLGVGGAPLCLAPLPSATARAAGAAETDGALGVEQHLAGIRGRGPSLAIGQAGRASEDGHPHGPGLCPAPCDGTALDSP